MYKLKTLTRNYLQRTGKNIFTFGYGMPKNAQDIFGTLGGTEYFITAKNEVYMLLHDNGNINKFIFIGLTNEFKNYN